MRTALRVCLLISVAILTSHSAHAQVGPMVDIGVRLGTDLGGDVEEEFLGVDARIALPSLPVVINPAFDFYFTPDQVDFYQFSVNALLAVNTAALPTIAPYVGAGLGISRSSVSADTPLGDFSASNTDIGINIVGGGAITVGSIKPFAQLQLTIGDPDLVTVAIGAHIKVSG